MCALDTFFTLSSPLRWGEDEVVTYRIKESVKGNGQVMGADSPAPVKNNSLLIGEKSLEFPYPIQRVLNFGVLLIVQLGGGEAASAGGAGQSPANNLYCVNRNCEITWNNLDVLLDFPDFVTGGLDDALIKRP